MKVTETILREIFTHLPDYEDSVGRSFPIRFEWGGQSDLILFLKTISGNKYPLIWLVEGEQTVDRYERSIYRSCKFIIAKDSKHVTNRNPTVWDTEFVDCLNPLSENVLKALERSGVSSINGKFKERRVANYTEEDLTKTVDFWNVIILDINLDFQTDRCINNIIF